MNIMIAKNSLKCDETNHGVHIPRNDFGTILRNDIQN